MNKESIVFIDAHPDDAEGFGATAFLLRDKFDLHVVDLTHGELGLGRKCAARRDLKRVLQLKPTDLWAAKLLKTND